MREGRERSSRTPTGLDRTSEREVILLGENYQLKEKVNRVIEHAEETIGELQVEMEQTKRYYAEREEKMQSIIDDLEKERASQQVAILSRDLKQEKLRDSKSSHNIEFQENCDWETKDDHRLPLDSTNDPYTARNLALSEMGEERTVSSQQG